MSPYIYSYGDIYIYEVFTLFGKGEILSLEKEI